MITLDTVTTAYTKTRDDIAELNKQIDELKALQARREEWLNSELVRLNLQNVKTPSGITVYRTIKESVTVADWDAVLNWIMTNDCYEYLTKGVNKSAVLEIMGRDRENPPPPGVNYIATRAIGVRKG